MLPRLVAATGGRVVVDPGAGEETRSPWRCYRACLEACSGSHVLVLQDDVEVCHGFPAAARAAVAERPDSLLVFFVGGQPQDAALAVRRAYQRDERWATLDPRRWVPVVALAWPADLAACCLEYVDGQGWPPEFRADDEIVGRFARDCRVDVWATVPSLVEHPDRVPSLIGRRAWAGRDKGRVAACYIGGHAGAGAGWAAGAVLSSPT